MANFSIRRNDVVHVTAGRDRGKQGRVLRIFRDTGRAVVEGINKIKRHTRPNPGKGLKGGIVEREGTIDISNLKLLCPECSEGTRVRHRIQADGSKVRICGCEKAITVDRKSGD